MSSPRDWKAVRRDSVKYLDEASGSREFQERVAELWEKADDLADGPDPSDHWQSAVLYSALAEQIESKGDVEKASDLAHFAGHQYRHVEAFNRAAIEYEHAGDFARTAGGERLEWALRSYGRARKLRTDLGEEDKAEGVLKKENSARLNYVRQQRSSSSHRRSDASGSSGWYLAGLWYWQAVAGSGLNPARILYWFSGYIFIFGFFYKFADAVPDSAANNFMSSFTYSLKVAFGDLPLQEAWWVQLVALMNFALIWVLLGTMIAVMTRRVPGR